MRRLILSAALAAVLPFGVALAQDQGTEVTMTAPSPSAVQHPVVVNLFGGVEGYSGNLASRVEPGPNWGVSVSYDPFPFGGFELGYTGAVNELRSKTTRSFDPNPNGADLIVNGGYAIVTPGYAFPMNASGSDTLKPYVLGGIGVDHYSPQGQTSRFGFSNETVANAPFGVGLKLKMGNLAADARASYAYQFGTQWATTDAHPFRYQGQLLLGAAF